MATSLDLTNKNMYMQYASMPSGVSVWVKSSLPYAVILSANDGQLYKIDRAQYDVEGLLKLGLLTHFVQLRAAFLSQTFGLTGTNLNTYQSLVNQFSPVYPIALNSIP